MKTINTIALNTFKETIRNRILINIFIFAFFIFILSVMIGEWSLGEQIKVISDFGLTGLHIIAVLIAIFIGINLVSKEINSRTIYNTLSKNIERWQFLIGHFLGLAITLFINMLLLGIVLILILSMYSATIDLGLFIPVIFIYGEMLIIIAFSILFSIITNTTLSAIYTIFIFIAGNLISDVVVMLENLEASNQVLNAIVKFLSWILPDLQNSNCVFGRTGE
jgi:ABC-type transport system involved in multi-copper enzyme maturation permease subunit